MALKIYATLLAFLLLQTSKGFAELAEDAELENLLASLESDSITKREENKVELPEDLIDNVDHMKENQQISELDLDDFPGTVATDDDSTPIEASFEPVGCFRDHGGSKRPLPVLLGSLRSQIDWHDLNKTIRACALLAKNKGYRYFGIQFYGECWSGPTADQTYNKDGASDRCVVGVGKTYANYVYRFKPDECSNYTKLDSGDRSEDNNGANGIFTCDKDITLGWYRFTGQAGTHMATTCPQKLHCGAHAPGWMSGTLPSVAEGAVNRKVCYNWNGDCCYWDSTILVKNCGGYYVYRLDKPPYCRLKYCGSSASAKKRTFVSDIPDITTIGLPESNEAMTVDSEDTSPRESTSRSLRQGTEKDTEMDMFLGNGNDAVLDEYEQVGCYRDRGGANRPLPILVANLRPQIDWRDLNKTIRACASLAQAKGYSYFGIQFYGECWSGPNAGQTYNKHGASPDGCVRGVGKAGSNFVYRFPEEEKTTVSTTTTATPLPDECTNYNQLDSANRSVNHGPNGIFECDKDLTPGWYRFTGPAGTQMATRCPQILHCGTHSPGWLNGALPSVAEGVVKRGVCFNWREDCCHFNTSVLVRNCGGFFVYELPKPPMCRLRYCGSNSALPTTSVVTTNKPTTRPLPPTPPPTPIRTYRLCEHRSGVLRCPPGQKIKIRYANYGRTEGRTVCPHRSIRTTQCYSSVAANLVRCACNGHNSCPLYAKNQVYGDPCVGTFKYIEVKYQCVMQALEDNMAMR